MESPKKVLYLQSFGIRALSSVAAIAWRLEGLLLSSSSAQSVQGAATLWRPTASDVPNQVPPNTTARLSPEDKVHVAISLAYSTLLLQRLPILAAQNKSLASVSRPYMPFFRGSNFYC
jgi:hypothetical protein